MDKFVIRSKKNSSDFQSVPAVTVSPCSNSEEIVDVHEDFNEPVPSGLTDQGIFTRNIIFFILSSYHSLSICQLIALY